MDFESLKRGYGNLWRKAVIKPEWQSRIDRAVAKIAAGRAQYEAVEALTGVPWRFIGALHMMESGCDFRTHLHNGDPLTARTRQAPPGRPAAAPANGRTYTWQESAIDALRLKGLHLVDSWTIERILYEAERYNGWGYMLHKIMSAYVWSGTNLYTRGKYTRDGHLDFNAVSLQAGIATLMKGLMEMQTLQDFLKPFAAVVPLLARSIGGDHDHVARLALGEALETEAKTGPVATDEAALLGALADLPISPLLTVLRAAEGVIGSIIPAPAEAPAPAGIVTIPAEAPAAGTAFDSLFGGALTGWKTYLAIGGAVIINGLAALHVAPGLLTPDTVNLIDVVLAGFGGASLISKIERLFGNARTPAQ